MVRSVECVSFASGNDDLAGPSSQAANPAHPNFHIPSCSPACYCDGHFPGGAPGMRGDLEWADSRACWGC
jgi:hypothetical protein